MAIILEIFLKQGLLTLFRSQCIYMSICLICGYISIHAQEDSYPAAQPQDMNLAGQRPNPNTLNSLGFGIGMITGDASSGRETLLLATRCSRKISTVSEIEFALHYHSTAVALFNSFDFRFAAITWNSDVSLFTVPFPSWQNFRIGGGLSVRRHIGSYTVNQTTISSSGAMQTIRLIEYQQALSAGASCKLDYILFTSSQLEATIRAQGYIYGMPISGEINQVPRGTPSGAVSIDMFIKTFF